MAAYERAGVTALRSRRTAAVLAVWALAMQVAAIVLLVPNLATIGLEHLGFNGAGGAAAGATYPVVGWLLASRRPENKIGWIFLVVGVSQAGTSFLAMYATYGLITNPGSVPLADIATWIGVWSWVPGFVLLFVMVLVFPDGALPSRRWRPVLWLAAVATVLMSIPGAVAAWGLRGVALLSEDTLSTPDTLLQIYIVASAIGQALMIPIGLAAVAGVLVRFRRSGTVERQQIKWFAAAATIEVGMLLVIGFALIAVTYPFDVLAAVVVVPLVPIAIALAVLRYRLFEIDRIVSRTLGWAIVTGLLVTVFVGLVVILETMLAPVMPENTLAVAASTLVAFALFQPLRRRVQRTVDRRFDRSRYDGQRTVDAFALHVRSNMDLGSLREALTVTADRAVRPAGATVWLASRRGR